MIPILIEAAKIMDDIFWQEAYGDKESFLSSISDEKKSRRFAEINSLGIVCWKRTIY